LKKQQYYIDNWEVEKCNPMVMTFSGFINNPTNKTDFKYTIDNYYECVQNIVQGYAGNSMEPFYYMTNVITILYSTISVIVNTMRTMIDYIRTSLLNIFNNIFGKLVNITSSIEIFFVDIRNLISRSLGLLVFYYYFLESTFLTLFSSIGSTIELIVIILAAMAVIIAILFIFQFTAPIAALLLFVYALILIPCLYIIVLFSSYVQISNVPHPYCFDKNTIIKLQNGQDKKISDIKINDVLEDGSIINGFFTLDATQQTMYKLNNIIVSGDDSNFKPSQETLIENLNFREALESVDSKEQLRQFIIDNMEEKLSIIDKIKQNFLDKNFADAAQNTIKLRYLEKLTEEIKSKYLVKQ